MENVQIKIGIIGLGRMGRFYLDEMRKSGMWDIAYVCDVNPLVRKEALQWGLDARIVSDEQVIFEDPSVQAVGLFTLAFYIGRPTVEPDREGGPLWEAHLGGKADCRFYRKGMESGRVGRESSSYCDRESLLA